jgi:hypothetical protein
MNVERRSEAHDAHKMMMRKEKPVPVVVVEVDVRPKRLVQARRKTLAGRGEDDEGC